MTNYMLVRHTVRDYPQWKRVYDDDLPNRIAAGVAERHLLTAADNPGNVFILFEAEDLARARAFAESTALRDTMQMAGVIDMPDIYFLNG